MRHGTASASASAGVVPVDDVVLRFADVGKTLGGRTVLDHLSFTARAGRVTGLAGGNGSGKSTVVRLAAGHLRPDRGEVLLAGRAPAAHRRLTDVVSVMGDMVGVPTDRSVRRTLRTMAALLDLRPEVLDEASAALGLDERARTSVASLSRGWHQRVKLAVAVAGRGRLLILDEPMNGLDAVSKEWLREHLLRRQAAGDAVVVVTHEYPELERLVDDLVVLAGTVRYSGPVLSPDAYSDLLRAA